MPPPLGEKRREGNTSSNSAKRALVCVTARSASCAALVPDTTALVSDAPCCYSFIASLSRPELITVMQAVDPLHRHSASGKQMMLDYLLKMPISRMSEMISAQPQLSTLVGRGSRKARKDASDLLLRGMPVACVLPRVTSLAGPGLADVSWIGQFERRDDNDFWFYVPPKRFFSRRGRCEQSSAVDDATTSHSHGTSSLMHEAADAECFNPAAPMQSHAAGSARSPSVHRADEFPQSEATVPGGQST